MFAKLFGSFEIFYGDVSLFWKRSRTSRAIKLLEILIVHADTGIARSDLLSYMFPDVEDPANALRVNMHRLKKMLLESGIPKAEIFVLEQGGGYFWNKEIPLKTDVQEFLSCIEQAGKEEDKERKGRLLYQACSIYKGELLEDMGAEEWVFIRSVKYKKLYQQALTQLIDLMRENGDYLHMLEVSKNASRIYPYDEWQVEQIESLVKTNRVTEAIEVYNSTLHKYSSELQIELPRRMVEKIRHINEDIVKTGPDIVKTIQDRMGECTEDDGAVYLNLPSFMDTFRIMVRIAERRGQPMCLMVCVLKEQNSELLVNPEKINASGDILEAAIKQTLRRGDSFTRYSDKQFLILLIGAEESQCEMIFDRINSAFKKLYRSRSITVSYYTVEAGNVNTNTSKVKITSNSIRIDDDI